MTPEQPCIAGALQQATSFAGQLLKPSSTHVIFGCRGSEHLQPECCIEDLFVTAAPE